MLFKLRKIIIIQKNIKKKEKTKREIKNRMTEFLERKIRTLFTRFDMDGNGSIEEDDFDRWSEKLVSLGLI